MHSSDSGLQILLSKIDFNQIQYMKGEILNIFYLL